MVDTAAATTRYPEVGVKFMLTLDGADPKNQPIAMMRADDFIDDFQHCGPTVQGTVTKRFKLVNVESCRNLDEVKQRCAEHGTLPEGQWREAFKDAFPTPDRKGPIGVPDASWVDSLGGALFPFVDSNGASGFNWVGNEYSARWRWLVCVGE